MKYVMIECENGGKTPVIFSESLTHVNVALALIADMNKEFMRRKNAEHGGE